MQPTTGLEKAIKSRKGVILAEKGCVTKEI